MNTLHLLDPELHALPDAFPSLDFTDERVVAMRAQFNAMAQMADAEAAGVQRTEVQFESADGTSVRGLLYRPANQGRTHPGYLHIHGGGYILGSPEGSDIGNVAVCSKLGVVVLSVDYRLAPEHPIPAPLDDCYAGLAWLHREASELNVDTGRIGIGGESAGGGLAAALAIKARDAGEFSVCHQHLTYPMLDDRTGTDDAPGDPLVGEFVWTRGSNRYGWTRYLGTAPAEAPQVPARVQSTEGLPPAWLSTATLDLFRDENILYANRLMAGGVPTELVVYPGACHGFQALPGTQLGARYIRDHMEALARGLRVESGEGSRDG